MTFTKTLGTLAREDGDGGIYKITMDKRENPYADYLDQAVDGPMAARQKR